MTEGKDDAPWVGARAMFEAPSMKAPSMEAPSTPTMTRATDGEPIAESKEAEGSTRGQPSGLIWEGSTWDACPSLCMCCAPLCCLSKKWKISEYQIELKSGCCGYQEDTLYTNRIKDISHESNCCLHVCCCGRGTVVMHVADVTHPELHLTTFGSRAIFKALKGLQKQHHHQHHMVIS